MKKQKINNKFKSNFVYYLRGVINYLLFFLVFIFFVRFFLVMPGRINGKSMESTFNDEDYFLVNKTQYLFSAPDRDDIVQIISATDPPKRMVKRVIGLPGETIQIRRGKVYLLDEFNNSKEIPLPENVDPSDFYTVMPQQNGVFQITLAPDYYYVLGDNRRESTDSRYFGPVHRTQIIGKIWVLP